MSSVGEESSVKSFGLMVWGWGGGCWWDRALFKICYHQFHYQICYLLGQVHPGPKLRTRNETTDAQNFEFLHYGKVFGGKEEEGWKTQKPNDTTKGGWLGAGRRVILLNFGIQPMESVAGETQNRMTKN